MFWMCQVRSMSLNAIKDAKEKYPDLLDEEERVWTHFIKNNKKDST